jgi:hypothetical protein
MHSGKERRSTAVVRPKRCMGRTEIPDLKLITSEPWLKRHVFNENEMAHSSECTG